MQTPTAEIPQTETSTTGRVVRGIRAAAETTGVAFEFLLAQATHESGLDPEARSRRSSAAGLFQFTASTWLEMVRLHGADHGLGDLATRITKAPDGRVDVADKALRRQILDLRKDPALSAAMAGEYARDNARLLERRLGRPASTSDLYLAHFLGASGAARVIETMEESPRSSARALLPDAARANPEMFRARTVAGLYGTVQSRFESVLSRHGRADLAVLRPEPRPDASDDAQADAIPPAAANPRLTLDAPSPGSEPRLALAEAPATPADAPTAAEAAPAAEPAPAVASAATPAEAFRALVGDSPYLSAAMPPRGTTSPGAAPPTMWEIVQAIKAGQDV